ncbi:hypothetical protein LKR43_12190 [Pusillimonas sp. MFBS29]|uniref:hypothetical protein n=1 Tax=Pusillimonas sp. MFBS29 TaxID=2886690 RepID=UPI001D12F2B7|nr:hypothetical protein [Pusillimonas sp. MFBS29]MCC2597101.1 hypothetical protein [Pusillimonas sp. MFBS29]
MTTQHHSRETDAPLHKKGPWHYVGITVLLAVMALAFAGYLSPEMRLQWANLAALCGF